MLEKDEPSFGTMSDHARGNMLRGYSTALEGWRRGLNLQIKIDHTNRMDEMVEYILDDGITTHHFEGSVGDRVSEDAVAICADKSILRGHLQKADIKIPDAKVFDESSPLETIREYVQKESHPLAVKSTDGNLVKHIHNDEEIKEAMEYLKDKMDGHKIIVEKHLEGENSQLYVVGEEVFHLTGQPASEDARKLALEAVRSIPGLPQGSVLININEGTEKCTVIDINPHADIKKNESLSGDALRDVPKAIMDYYFPATKDYDREMAERLYFDFDHVYTSSKRGKLGYMEIPSIPEDVRLTRFILMAEGFPKSFLGWVQSAAVKRGVSGSIRKLSERRISLVLGGSREDINAFTNLLRKKCQRFKHPVKFIRKKRVTPVMQGFHIIENPSLDSKKVKSLRQENKKLKKEIAALKKTRPDTSKNNYRKFIRRLASVRKKGQ